MINTFKRTSVVSTATSDENTPSSSQWERASPKEGFNLEKPRVKATTGPSIRNMLNNLNPEKD